MRTACAVRNKKMKDRARQILILTTLAIIMICTLLLCACNKVDNDDEKIVEKPLYLVSIDAKQSIVRAVLRFGGEESEKIDGVSAFWQQEDTSSDTWYRVSPTKVQLDHNAIFSVVQTLVAQEIIEIDGIDNLGIEVVLEYDTIYKSIKSNGQRTYENGKYVHRFWIHPTNEGDDFVIEVTNPNSANWYALLMGIAIVVAGVVLIVYLLIKGGIWQKKKKD